MTARLACLVVLAASGVAAAGQGVASAAPWCGTTTTTDRPPAVAGPSIRVVYALPSDAPDASATRAGRLSADVDEVAAWWRGQDPAREPRFDRAAFACGPQADVLVVRLAQDTAALRSDETRFDLVVRAVEAATGRSRYDKHLVYFDGPVTDTNLCGEGGGGPDGGGVAIVYLGACSGVPSSAVAAHELLHAFGALPEAGPPHACQDSLAHVCDSASDLLAATTTGTALGSLTLDVGRDDYYAHAGAWLDVEDSRWLRLVTRQVALTLALAGRGSVVSDVPGVSCAAGCVTEWDAGSIVSLVPQAADGQRFVRWAGACSGSDACSVTLESSQTVSALFAAARFGLVLSVNGRGSVSGLGAPCRLTRCRRSAESFTPVRLRATAAPGWRFVGWGGACSGRRATCVVPMTRAASVRARFAAR